MSDYSEIRKAYESRIQTFYGLQQAQPEGSEHWKRYAARINALTTVLGQFEDNLERLGELDRLLAEADMDLKRAMHRVDAGAAPWPRLGAWTGGLGATGLLGGLSAHWLPSYVPTGGVVSLMLAAGCVAMTIRKRRVGQDELHNAQVELYRLLAQRDGLLPAAIDEVIAVADSKGRAA